MSYVLALDVGTSGTRCLLVDDTGAVIASASQEYAFESPKIGWAEQSPDIWWEAVSTTVRKIVRGNPGAKEETRCIGLSGQMHGTVFLDKANQVIRPCMLWCDGRATAQVDSIERKLSREVKRKILANPVLAGFPAPKVLWLRDQEPANFDKLAKLLLPKDYVRYRLTGEIATDVSDASGTLFLDVPKRGWSKGILELLGLDESLLPPIYESSEVAGRLSRRAADGLGLKEGMPVIAGGGDAVVATIGTGIISRGKALSVLGTGGNVTVFSDKPALDSRVRLNTFCSCMPDKWVLLGVQQSAGFSLRWLRDNIGLFSSEIGNHKDEDPYEIMIGASEEVPPGSGGLVFLPYLMGERTPHMDPYARGAFVGLSASHSRAHMVRAVLEGVIFAMRETLEIVRECGVPVTEVLATGGGARSAFWLQLQADIFKSKVATLNISEGSAYGAALLAGVAAGFWGSIEQACQATLSVTTTYHPRSEFVSIYNQVYEEYTRLYPVLKPSFHRLYHLGQT